ncbi:hypothetical protein FACS18945_5850 [Bacteroidia bacterium]|nr:hypothetical protein FACS18945_5850 [Bacteroidia bacterium]
MNIKKTTVKKGDSFYLSGKKYMLAKGNIIVPYSTHAEAVKYKEIGEGYKAHRYYQIDGYYVLIVYERYPCFDSWDYAHENRCYNYNLICRSMEELKRKHEYFISNSDHLYNATQVCPYVLVDDGCSDEFFVFTEDDAVDTAETPAAGKSS